MIGVFVGFAEVCPCGGLQVGRRGQFVHQVGHHHAVSLHSHAAWPDVAVQQPTAIRSGALAGLDVFVSKVFQHQGVRVAQEAGGCGVARDLVVEEHAPVISVGHGQFAVGQSQAAEHFVHDFLVVVHQGVGFPFGILALEEVEGQMGFAQFLHHHVLVGGVEIVVVLQGVVVIQVFADIQVLHGLVVIVRVDDRGIVGIVHVGIAVDGELSQAGEPLRRQRVVGVQSQCAGQDVGLPSVLFRFRVAAEACGDASLQFVVAFRLNHIVYVGLLRVAQFVFQEKGRIGQ